LLRGSTEPRSMDEMVSGNLPRYVAMRLAIMLAMEEARNSPAEEDSVYRPPAVRPELSRRRT
jgi:hypothetical protein